MIVKNESKIITRCLDQVKEIVDCICICDTGSEDNTVEIIEDFCRKIIFQEKCTTMIGKTLGTIEIYL